MYTIITIGWPCKVGVNNDEGNVHEAMFIVKIYYPYMKFVRQYRFNSCIDKQLKHIGWLAPYVTLACRGQHCRLKDSFQMNHSPISSTSNKTSDIDSHRSTRQKKKCTQVKNCHGII